MPGRVRVHLESVLSIDVARGLEQSRTECHRFVVSRPDVVHEEVEVNLLRLAVGPIGLNMVGGKLEGDPRRPVDEYGVPVIFGFDRSPEEAGPEGTLRSEIGGVEDDNLTCDVHRASEVEGTDIPQAEF